MKNTPAAHGKYVMISMGYGAPGHCRLKSSPIGVAQPLVLSVHQLVNCVVIQNAVRLDRSRKLREFLSVEQTLVNRIHTFI